MINHILTLPNAIEFTFQSSNNKINAERQTMILDIDLTDCGSLEEIYSQLRQSLFLDASDKANFATGSKKN